MTSQFTADNIAGVLRARKFRYSESRTGAAEINHETVESGNPTRRLNSPFAATLDAAGQRVRSPK